MEVSREEILALIAEFAGDRDENARIDRYVDELIGLRGRLAHAEANNAQLARHRRTDDLEPKTVALVESLRDTVARQDTEIARLKKELGIAYSNNHDRNVELDALHFVWCDGGCEGGAHRYDEAPEKVTAEVVEAAKRNTTRLCSWFLNHKDRARYARERAKDGA